MTSNEGNPPTTSDDAKTDSAFNPDDIAPKPPRAETEPLSAQAQKVGNLIKQGYRVMVLMRGLPGVGKTYSARSIVKNYVDLQPPFCSVGDFIFSTDDYFYNAKGVYKYNVNLLNEAHEFNQYRVREKAMSGFSPIFVDNTNMKAWEMLPYVKCAIENGYLIEIIEPKPSWRKSPNVLARRNLHGVPADKIRHMIDKYEKTSVPELLKASHIHTILYSLHHKVECMFKFPGRWQNIEIFPRDPIKHIFVIRSSIAKIIKIRNLNQFQ